MGRLGAKMVIDAPSRESAHRGTDAFEREPMSNPVESESAHLVFFSGLRCGVIGGKMDVTERSVMRV
jgi:hypothetical protein